MSKLLDATKEGIKNGLKSTNFGATLWGEAKVGVVVVLRCTIKVFLSCFIAPMPTVMTVITGGSQ